MKAGIYAMSAAEYHADPAPEPSLSSSIASVLCSQSPRHAFAKHPRLSAVVAEESTEFDLGTAAHSILLEGVDIVTPIDAENYRTNAAKDARDAARAGGRVPLLRHHIAKVTGMLAETRQQLDAHEDGRLMFQNGQAEPVLMWQEPDFGNLWCRARLDYLRPGAIDDFKTTQASANPDAWLRTMLGMGADIQAAFYRRGLLAVTGEDAEFRFAVQELDSPHALAVIGLSPGFMTLAEKKVIYGLELWQRCIESDKWPAYPTRTCYLDLPAWEESRWLEKELR